jgi:hypothetical protein
MPTVAGIYLTHRKGIRYTYAATWRDAGEGIVWNATLTRDGEVVDTPSGNIRTAIAGHVAEHLRGVMERAIERHAAWRRLPRALKKVTAEVLPTASQS